MATIAPEVASHRARVASLSRSRANNDPELLDARRALRASQLESHIARVLAGAPPLTDDQRRRLAGLFTGGASK